MEALKNPERKWFENTESKDYLDKFKNDFLKEVKILLDKLNNFSGPLKDILELQLCIKHALLIFQESFNDSSLFENFRSSETNKFNRLKLITI